MSRFAELTVLIRVAGEVASAVAYTLHYCHFKVCMTETENPLAISRGVAFSEAVYNGEKEVQGWQLS